MQGSGGRFLQYPVQSVREDITKFRIARLEDIIMTINTKFEIGEQVVIKNYNYRIPVKYLFGEIAMAVIHKDGSVKYRVRVMVKDEGHFDWDIWEEDLLRHRLDYEKEAIK